jgi:hypothetical protein
VLLLPPRRQIPKDHREFINDGVLVLDFLKCGDMSKEKRKDIRKSWVNSLAQKYGKSWAFVSPYPNILDESPVEFTGKSNELPTKEIAKPSSDT